MRVVVGAGLWLGVLLGTICPQATARDLYVSNTSGDDTFSGTAPKSGEGHIGPVRTIAMALRLAHQGDRVILEKTAAPYCESVTLEGTDRSGGPQLKFMIVGNGAILDGTAPVPEDGWENYRGPVFRFHPPRRQYQQLFREGKPLAAVAANPLIDVPPTLKPLQSCWHHGYLYFCVEENKLPQDYQLSYSMHDVGITLYHVDSVAITDLVVQGFRLDGINAFNSARNVRLLRVTSRGNGRTGIAVGGASVVEIESSLVGNNGTAQVLALPWSEIQVRQCDLLSNTAPALVDEGGQVFVEGKRIVGGIDDRKVPE
jgi:hypothetical protein